MATLMNPKVLLVLIILYFVYMILGAVAFMLMERPYEVKRCEEAKKIKKTWVDKVQESDVFDDDLMNEFIANVTRFVGFGISLQGEVKCPTNWNFQSALFFTGTIITTIGYGNLAPVLWYSQIFCIIYAFIGIPLFAIMFSGLGQYLSEAVKIVIANFNLFQTTAMEQKIIKSAFSFVLIVGGSLIFFQLIPAIIFMHVEDWSYRESFYYCFTTLTTIGFGDYVVGSNPEKNYIALYRVMVLFWILFGLAYTFTAINLIVEIFRRTFQKSAFAQFCITNWEEADEQARSELESLLGAGSSNGGEDAMAGIEDIVRDLGELTEPISTDAPGETNNADSGINRPGDSSNQPSADTTTTTG